MNSNLISEEELLNTIPKFFHLINKLVMLKLMSNVVMISLKISLTQEDPKLRRTLLKSKTILKKTVRLLMKPTLLEKTNMKLSSSKWKNTTQLLNQLMKHLL